MQVNVRTAKARLRQKPRLRVAGKPRSPPGCSCTPWFPRFHSRNNHFGRFHSPPFDAQHKRQTVTTNGKLRNLNRVNEVYRVHANDANCISCITTPQKSPPTQPQKTFPRRTLLPRHVSSLRVPFAGHPPQTA